MKRTFILLLLLVFVFAQPVRAAEPSVSAVSAILVDGESGRVLYEKNAEERRLIASITKLMTALVAAEHCPDLSRKITVRAEWTGAEGSSMYLRTGETLTLESLLYGLLMASGNDAALAVAGGCAGDVETFVDWMNRKAETLGMADTHFANPNGLNDAAHYSTAADMAKLAQACLRRPEIMKIVSTKTISIAGRSFTNHNKLLWRYDGCVGMKTGYTEKAGRTLISCARRNGGSLICVTLNDPNDWSDHAALLDYGFETYSRQVLTTAGEEVCRLPVEGSLNRFLPVCAAEDVAYMLSSNERIRTKLVLPGRVAAPVCRGEKAGELLFILNESVVERTTLIYGNDAADNRAEAGFLARILERFCIGSAAETAALLYSQ